MSAAAGLHEAIGVTARVAPLPIRAEVQDLAARLRREPLSQAARHFAARLANPAGDHVAVALILASERHGARLSEVLGQVAAATRAEASLRLRIEAQRARTYSQARLISGVIGAVVAAYIVLNRSYLAPFGTPIGQVVLAGVCALWFGSLWALLRLAEVAPGERVLAPVASSGSTER
jgi:Flp pilus assembly protein TadB